MNQLEKSVMYLLLSLLPALFAIPLFIAYFPLMWYGYTTVLMFVSAYLLACWAVLNVKLLKEKKDAVKQFLLLHLVPFSIALLGVLSVTIPKYENFCTISMLYFEPIWPLMILCASKVDPQVTAYYSGTTWTVYAIGFVMMLLAGAIGIGIKSRLLGNEEGCEPQ